MRSPRPIRKLLAGISEARAGHAARHRPTGLGFLLADSIAYVDASQWDAVTRESSLFLQRPYLAALERACPANMQLRYAVIYRGPQPVAATAMQLLTVSGDRLFKQNGAGNGNGSARLLARALDARRKLSRRIEERILVCGNLLSWGFHAAAFAPGEDAAALWPAVAEAIYRVRRAERLSGQTNLVMIKDVCEVHSHAAALRAFSYRPLETEPNMVLELRPEWLSYDDYLASLDGSYRKSARKVFKEVEAAGCVVESLNEMDSCAQRLHELYLAVHENAALRLVTLPPEYLPALQLAWRERLRTTVIRRGSELLGFVTTIHDGDTAIAYYVGFDRQAAQGIPLYLRLMHCTVADAIAFGCRRLSLGRTALEPKARLGARPEKTHIWLRHRVPAMNLLIRNLLRAVHHQEPPERHPFKPVAST